MQYADIYELAVIKKKKTIVKELNNKYVLDWQDKSFIKSFSKNIKSFSPKEREITILRFIEIFNSEVNNITDKQSQSHQIMCSFVLAAFENLASKKGTKEAIEELTETLKKFGGKYVQWSMKIMLWVKRDKKKFIENAATEKSKETYGESFIISEERNENQFTSIVKKCGYFEFFKRKDKPELTKVFCEWDSLWADEINKQNCGIRFKRPTTIANKNEDCRFEFHYKK